MEMGKGDIGVLQQLDPMVCHFNGTIATIDLVLNPGDNLVFTLVGENDPKQFNIKDRSYVVDLLDGNSMLIYRTQIRPVDDPDADDEEILDILDILDLIGNGEVVTA